MKRWLWLAFGVFIVASGFVSAQVAPLVQTTFASLTAARFSGSGTAPSCASTGLGTGSAAIATGSTDLSGSCLLSPTGAPSTAGTMTLTFTTGSGGYGGNGGPPCVLTLANGTGTWNTASLVRQNSYSTTAPPFTWDNNAVALAAGSTYSINYVCIGR